MAAPTLTSNPANRAQNAPTVTLSGTGFSATPANNSVVFNLGAVGVVTAATATQLTVTFTTSPTFTGSLTANVTVFGGSSGATQVATVVAATVAPQITCPADITTNAAGYCVPTIEFASTVTAGNPAPVVTYTIGTNIITSPYAFPIGINSVTSTATNVAGTDSCSFNVTVAAGDAPQLNILHDSTNVVVSWSDSFSCYTFEFALLLSSNSWSTYPGPYAMNNGKIFVTNSAPFTNRFFRLRF